jgi:hypothetical protein
MQRDRTVVFGESYIVAAYLDGYSKRYQLPEAYSANRSYGYFPSPPTDHDTLLYIGREPVQCARTSPMCKRSVTSARTCMRIC